ncbi:carbohydrate ABC transporter permease [Paenibacillus hamazuiensis]|uniref:carbohydrate ABC transporter permease n=1 Tax=Paenibacillus hamazuiensis TaxID=2936508 RepID=UPI002010B76B|nr:sugar ABC transporter permease [Paenibacillus hamazuiensis]
MLIVPSLVFFIVFHWEPLLSGIVLSFYKTEGYRAVQFIGLQNYIDVITNSVFQQTLVNTFLYVIWSLIIGFLVPIAAAIMINEMRMFQSFFKFAVFFPGMVPGIAAALLYVILFEPGAGGILNALIGKIGLPPSQWLQNAQLTIPLIVLVMTWRSFGATAIIYLAGLQGINHELYEAASLDGAGVWRKLRHITIPQISSFVGMLLILQVIGVFQVLYEPLTMTEGGPNNASMSLSLLSYQYAFRYFQAGQSLAVGGISFVIISLITIVYYLINKKDRTD